MVHHEDHIDRVPLVVVEFNIGARKHSRVIIAVVQRHDDLAAAFTVAFDYYYGAVAALEFW